MENLNPNMFSPFLSQKNMQSPPRLCKQSSSFGYNWAADTMQSGWSLIKKDCLMATPSVYSKSPMNKYEHFNLRHTPRASGDRSSDAKLRFTPTTTEFNINKVQAKMHNGQRSRKLLDFEGSEKTESVRLRETPVKSISRDTIGLNSSFISPITRTRSFENELAYPFAQENIGFTSPMIQPFQLSPNYTSGAHCDKDGSTASNSEVLIDENSMFVYETGAQRNTRNSFEKFCSLTLRHLQLNQSDEGQYQNFAQTPQKKANNASPAKRSNFRPATTKATFGEYSFLKIAKSRQSPQKKSTLKSKEVSKRVVKSAKKEQTLMEKLVSSQKKAPQSEIKETKPASLTAQEKPATKKCTCAKSKCLKLYCECFANGQVCGIDCGCVGCHNNEESGDVIQQAKEDILKRNPEAFTSKMASGKRLQHRKGCTCKRSGCQKGYCECFQMGVVCSDWCKCSGCANCESGHGSHGSSSKKKAKLH